MKNLDKNSRKNLVPISVSIKIVLKTFMIGTI